MGHRRKQLGSRYRHQGLEGWVSQNLIQKHGVHIASHTFGGTAGNWRELDSRRGRGR